jgi:hypothetical protein
VETCFLIAEVGNIDICTAKNEILCSLFPINIELHLIALGNRMKSLMAGWDGNQQYCQDVIRFHSQMEFIIVCSEFYHPNPEKDQIP